MHPILSFSTELLDGAVAGGLDVRGRCCRLAAAASRRMCGSSVPREGYRTRMALGLERTPRIFSGGLKGRWRARQEGMGEGPPQQQHREFVGGDARGREEKGTVSFWGARGVVG